MDAIGNIICTTSPAHSDVKTEQRSRVNELRLSTGNTHRETVGLKTLKRFIYRMCASSVCVDMGDEIIVWGVPYQRW